MALSDKSIFKRQGTADFQEMLKEKQRAVKLTVQDRKIAATLTERKENQIYI